MHLALELGVWGVVLFVGHFLVHAMVWETIKMGTKHIYRKIMKKKCQAIYFINKY